MKFSRLPILLFLLLGTVLVFASGLDVPATDPVYRFLQRMEIRGVITGYHDNMLPLTRTEIAAYLQDVQRNCRALQRVEKSILGEFLADYRRELQPHPHTDIDTTSSYAFPGLNGSQLRRKAAGVFSRMDRQEEKHLWVYERKDRFLWLDVGGGIQLENKSDQWRSLNYDKVQIRGQLGRQLSFQLATDRFRKSWNPAFTDTLAEQYGKWGMYQSDSTFTFDDVFSSISYHHRLFAIGFHRQQVLWGPARRNGLLFSDRSSPLAYVEFATRYKAVRFRSMHANLLNDSTAIKSAPMETRNLEKHIAAHRFDITLLKDRLELGLTDVVIYGGRGIELAYLSPVNFYWAVEHSLMDRDNALLALDFTAHPVQNLNLYGTILLDELRFSEIGQKWWANKHALQAGIRYACNLLKAPLNLQLEFTAVRPWTYTHQDLLSNYSNNGFALGFPYGPNSQLWFLAVDSDLSRRCMLGAEFCSLRKGEDTASKIWGGDLQSSYLDRDKEYDHTTGWLMGDIRKSHILLLYLRYEIFNDCYLLGRLRYEQDHFQGKQTEQTYLVAGLSVNI